MHGNSQRLIQESMILDDGADPISTVRSCRDGKKQKNGVLDAEALWIQLELRTGFESDQNSELNGPKKLAPRKSPVYKPVDSVEAVVRSKAVPKVVAETKRKEKLPAGSPEGSQMLTFRHTGFESDQNSKLNGPKKLAPLKSPPVDSVEAVDDNKALSKVVADTKRKGKLPAGSPKGSQTLTLRRTGF
ncbi:hypothetical protein FF38_08336 [Lucilia cuprina]|uniref:Uncharacterized protein n=1 Tax=Lucilia cuprina TaxID=7375 RepID=A0A0L0BWZ5_LUCCU|nr:hypothetical protein FF38_08336 [Lucilia cuprina]